MCIYLANTEDERLAWRKLRVKVLVQKHSLPNMYPVILIRRESFVCVYVCLLKNRGRSVGHTPSGEQCSTLGVGMSVGAGLAYEDFDLLFKLLVCAVNFLQ